MSETFILCCKAKQRQKTGQLTFFLPKIYFVRYLAEPSVNLNNINKKPVDTFYWYYCANMFCLYRQTLEVNDLAKY